MSVRTDTRDRFVEEWSQIEDLAKIHVIATEKDLKALGGTTAVITQYGFAAVEEAPRGARNILMFLEVISSITDLDMAQDELDEIIPAVLDYLDPRYEHETAEAVVYGTLLAYRIPFKVISTPLGVAQHG